MTGRLPSGTPLDALRSALRSPYPMLRGAAEQTIRGALDAPSWAAAARDLGINPRSFEQFLADFPQVREWREEILKNRT